LYDKGIFVLSVFLAIINFCSFISPFGIWTYTLSPLE
jgi:hypothetical protein